MKIKHLVLAAVTAATVLGGSSFVQASHAKTVTPTLTAAKQSAMTTKVATKIAKKYVGDYYAYMGVNANCWYKLSVRQNKVTYAYVNAKGKTVSVGSMVNGKWVKRANHGTLWSSTGVKHTQTVVDTKTNKKTTTTYYTNKIGFVDNYNKYGATFNGNEATQVSYTVHNKQLTYLLNYEYYKLGKVKVNKKTYRVLNQTVLQQIYGTKTTSVKGGLTFVKNARISRLMGKSYTKKQINADLNAQRHYTTPKAMRGTWYAYAGKHRWMVVKIGERSYTSYLLQNKKKSSVYMALPGVSAKTNLLWVIRHHKKHRAYYTFTPYLSGSKSIGRHYMLKIKVNKKRYTALVISLKAKQNIVFLKHKPSKNLNFISKKDLAQ